MELRKSGKLQKRLRKLCNSKWQIQIFWNFSPTLFDFHQFLIS